MWANKVDRKDEERIEKTRRQENASQYRVTKPDGCPDSVQKVESDGPVRSRRILRLHARGRLWSALRWCFFSPRFRRYSPRKVGRRLIITTGQVGLCRAGNPRGDYFCHRFVLLFKMTALPFRSSLDSLSRGTAFFSLFRQQCRGAVFSESCLLHSAFGGCGIPIHSSILGRGHFSVVVVVVGVSEMSE